jgi:glycerol kinase
VLRVDGGMCANDAMCQFQADISGVSVQRPAVLEATATGAAYAAGLATGFWKNASQLSKLTQQSSALSPGKEKKSGGAALTKVFSPKMTEARRLQLYRQWNKAVASTYGWVDGKAGIGSGSSKRISSSSGGGSVATRAGLVAVGFAAGLLVAAAVWKGSHLLSSTSSSSSK